jgi:hypothetical protein
MSGVPPLRAGDRVLWQGRPSWLAFAQQVMHVRWIAAYVALLLSWCLVAGMQNSGLSSALDTTMRFGGLALVAMGLLLALAWGLARTTTYSLTTSHLVIEYGLALAKTVTIPYAKIVDASFRPYANGTGDIVFTLGDTRGASYPLMWPHVRPWKMKRPQPMLRVVEDGAQVAQIVARALAASADMAPVPISLPETRPAVAGAAAAAA